MRMWIIAAALGSAMLGGFVSAGAAAQSPAAPASAMPDDQDGDRIVTRAEAIANADRRFAAMDTNHDGKLTGDERRAWREQQRAPQRFSGRGRRDDAQTQAQFRDRSLKRFDRIDTNHDGTIDARERDAMLLMMRARRVGHDRADPAAPTG